ncbi:phage portal protein [Streptomyces silaceus]|uniref:phage portal protein n=1 Tax=Streptomyces silaceus TaxID=545123 RepID=UPI0006EB3913|nr:phage portal protein [Streptomyces silaceus]
MGRTLLGSLASAAASAVNRTPIPFAPATGRAGFGSGFVRPAGQEAQMRAMGGSSTLYAIVDRITTTYAGVEWKLYRSATSGRDEDRVEVTSHAALDLWNAPNRHMTGPAFRESAQQHEELTGEQWWVIACHERSSIPLELWPVRPDRMEPVPDPQEFLLGYVYRGPSGERVPLGVDDVISLRRPNPLDPYRGMGVVQTILMDIDATRASAEWNANFFRNSAEPGGVVEVDRRLSDDEFEEFRTRWGEQHRGVSNAHRVGVLENGLKWVDRKYSMRDMQFTELRSVNREIIREAFGFPKPMLGATDDVNRANAEAAAYVFARWLIQPRLERVREMLNTRLLPLYGATARGLEFDFVSPVPEDKEAEATILGQRAQAAATLQTAGFSPADVLSTVDLPEMAARPADEQLLVDIVRGAPATAPLILPLLGFNVPGLDAQPANRWAPPPWVTNEIEAARRWVAVAEDDDNTCGPCSENNGRTYKNRADAYEDYPGGRGYVNCVGAEYGNDCRCRVVKRGRKGASE